MVRLISASVYQRAVQGISMSSMRIFFLSSKSTCFLTISPKSLSLIPWFQTDRLSSFSSRTKTSIFLKFFLHSKVLYYSKRFEWHPSSITKIQLLYERTCSGPYEKEERGGYSDSCEPRPPAPVRVRRRRRCHPQRAAMHPLPLFPLCCCVAGSGVRCYRGR